MVSGPRAAQGQIGVTADPGVLAHEALGALCHPLIMDLTRHVGAQLGICLGACVESTKADRRGRRDLGRQRHRAGRDEAVVGQREHRGERHQKLTRGLDLECDLRRVAAMDGLADHHLANCGISVGQGQKLSRDTILCQAPKRRRGRLPELEQAIARIVQNDDRRREILTRVRVPDRQLIDPAWLAGIDRSGQLMRPQIEQIWQQTEAAKTTAQSFLKLEDAALNLGLMCTIGPLRAISFLNSFWRDHPGIEITLLEGAPSRLAELLYDGSLDVAVMAKADGFEERSDLVPLYREHFVLAFPAGHRFEQQNASTTSGARRTCAASTASIISPISAVSLASAGGLPIEASGRTGSRPW